MVDSSNELRGMHPCVEKTGGRALAKLLPVKKVL